MIAVQFPTLGRDEECSCCYYNTVYDVCKNCKTALRDDNRAVVHGLDPATGQVHLDLCEQCAARLAL
jgi:hypothetical protein